MHPDQGMYSKEGPACSPVSSPSPSARGLGKRSPGQSTSMSDGINTTGTGNKTGSKVLERGHNNNVRPLFSRHGSLPFDCDVMSTKFGDVVISKGSGEGTGRQRSHSMSKVLRVKEEIHRKLKQTLMTRRLPARMMAESGYHSNGGRRISVDLAAYSRRRSAPPIYEELGLDDVTGSDRNFSNCLVLRSLCDGQFTADFPLEALPTGDLIIRVRCFKLQIIIKVTDQHVDNVTYQQGAYVYYGYIEIPIYVDYNTLEFDIRSGTETHMVITGQMKGSLNPPTPKVSPSSSVIEMSPKRRVVEAWHNRLSCSRSQEEEEEEELETDDFRGRCYTR